jgi:hypothetical protein
LASPPNSSATALSTTEPVLLAATPRHGECWLGQSAGEKGLHNLIDLASDESEHNDTASYQFAV